MMTPSGPLMVNDSSTRFCGCRVLAILRGGGIGAWKGGGSGERRREREDEMQKKSSPFYFPFEPKCFTRSSPPPPFFSSSACFHSLPFLVSSDANTATGRIGRAATGAHWIGGLARPQPLDRLGWSSSWPSICYGRRESF